MRKIIFEITMAVIGFIVRIIINLIVDRFN